MCADPLKTPQKPLKTLFLHSKIAPKNPLFWQKPPILGIFLILANFGDFRYFEESPRFWQVLKNDHLDDFQQCRRRDQNRGHVCEEDTHASGQSSRTLLRVEESRWS